MTEVDTQIESDNELKFKSCEKSKRSVTTPLRIEKPKANLTQHPIQSAGGEPDVKLLEG